MNHADIDVTLGYNDVLALFQATLAIMDQAAATGHQLDPEFGFTVGVLQRTAEHLNMAHDLASWDGNFTSETPAPTDIVDTPRIEGAP